MNRLDKLILIMTYWTVGSAVENPEVADARWSRLTAGLPKTEDNLMQVIGWIVNEIDGTRVDWSAFQGFMETKSEEAERIAADDNLASGIDVVN